MKQILILAFSLVTLISCEEKGGSVVGQKTTMELKQEYKVGNVAKGEKINTAIEVKNTGEYPLIIANVTGQCSCTVTDKPSEPIAPGETGIIKSVIDTDNFVAGAISKTVSITANTEPSVSRVVIKANIIN
ncbi:MAG: DUF1573 domain-containing protein [Lishizhenia sp.]